MDAFSAPELAKFSYRLWFSRYIGDFGDVRVHLLRRDTLKRACPIQLPIDPSLFINRFNIPSSFLYRTNVRPPRETCQLASEPFATI